MKIVKDKLENLMNSASSSKVWAPNSEDLDRLLKAVRSEVLSVKKEVARMYSERAESVSVVAEVPKNFEQRIVCLKVALAYRNRAKS